MLPPAYKSEQDLSLNAYEYRYDRFRRCVWTRLPGCSPFGGLMAVNVCVRNVQPYKYIGKELDWMFGWNMLDNEARWYYASAIRWWNIDGLAGKHPKTSFFIYDQLNNLIQYYNEKGVYKTAPLVLAY